MTKLTVIFRTDGNSSIGFGHVSRCLALGEILSDRYTISFALGAADPDLLRMVRQLTSNIIILGGASAAPGELNSYLGGKEIVVLDGYQFSAEYEQQLKEAAGAIISIDDIPSRHFFADGVINFNEGVSPDQYSREYYTRLFIGFRYLFLRFPFLRKPIVKNFHNRLFLNMGGSDANNITLRILNDLAGRYAGEVEVVVGSHYAYAESLSTFVSNHKEITLHVGLSPIEMFAVMDKCSLAIVPPSTVALEFLSTGGLVFVYQTADNQELLGRYLTSNGLAEHYSDFDTIKGVGFPARFEKALERQKGVFGESPFAAVYKLFAELELETALNLRLATIDDMQTSFEWANDPETRSQSFESNPIPWETHVQWYQKKMTDDQCVYLIGDIGGVPVGQIRFDAVSGTQAYQISYLLDKGWRGKGLGRSLLVRGIRSIREQRAVNQIVAYVRRKNVASERAFLSARFKQSIATEYPDSFKFELYF